MDGSAFRMGPHACRNAVAPTIQFLFLISPIIGIQRCDHFQRLEFSDLAQRETPDEPALNGQMQSESHSECSQPRRRPSTTNGKIDLRAPYRDGCTLARTRGVVAKIAAARNDRGQIPRIAPADVHPMPAHRTHHMSRIAGERNASARESRRKKMLDAKSGQRFGCPAESGAGSFRNACGESAHVGNLR